MASMKKPVKKSASTSNRVKPVSSAAKVRMADEKATKAAAAKAPRYPRGMQGYGMDTSKGNVYTSGSKSIPSNRLSGTYVTVIAKNKNDARSLLKTTVNSKSAGVKGKKVNKNDYFATEGKYMDSKGGGYDIMKQFVTKKQPSVKKKSPKKGK